MACDDGLATACVVVRHRTTAATATYHSTRSGTLWYFHKPAPMARAGVDGGLFIPEATNEATNSQTSRGTTEERTRWPGGRQGAPPTHRRAGEGVEPMARGSPPVEGSPGVGRGLCIVYDETCPLCQRLVEWLRRLDRHRALTFRPLQDHGFLARHGVDPRRAALRMQLVLPTSKVYEGFPALYQLARALPSLRVFLPLLWLARVTGAGPRLYDALARRRHAVSRIIFGNSCHCAPLPGSPPTGGTTTGNSGRMSRRPNEKTLEKSKS